MSNKDIQILENIAKDHAKQVITRDNAMIALKDAGILTRDGNFTKHYQTLSKVVKDIL